ncbi:hypothetical protein EVAR_47520_1 [Eumeta japonica]|uniref:Uncharacterized protein n=1 Tax=Eumeta variegata TaxID=151549 RepID=A0A4C1XS77_EUMVA|nr:hypothetical protein EVAR_47520_1 [Eumeta japonica]
MPSVRLQPDNFAELAAWRRARRRPSVETNQFISRPAVTCYLSFRVARARPRRPAGLNELSVTALRSIFIYVAQILGGPFTDEVMRELKNLPRACRIMLIIGFRSHYYKEIHYR